MASLAALVASLASSVQRTAVGRGAVTRDVAELATSVALHGLSLAIPREVVRASALVAGGGAGTTSETATSVAAESTTRNGGATSDADAGRVGAGTLF